MVTAQIYGGVIVKGKEYLDDDIAKLLQVKFTRWRPAGDLDKDEADVFVRIGRLKRTFSGKDYLPEALEFLRSHQPLNFK